MSVARKDWIEFARDRRLVVLAALALLIALAALATSWVRVAAHEADRVAAQAQEVASWNGQGARNPHGAAHFGEWAMRPLTAMALLEPGVTSYAGGSIALEAHARYIARNRPVEDQENLLDLGSFSAAWALQILVPLVIFVLAAGLVARERERGTLRLLLAGGLPARRLIASKLQSLARLVGLLALPVLAAAFVAVMLAGSAEIGRLLLWCAAHLVFLLIVAFIALAVSALSRTSAQALLVLAGIWLVAILLVPRAAAFAEISRPVPASDAFVTAMLEEKGRLPDVFADDAAFTAQTLRRYGVSRREDLPVDLAGLQLEEDERLGNIVWDRFFGEVDAIYSAQRGIVRWASILSPLPAVQNLSQALAGTGMPDQVDFQNQAEAHRRRLVTFLNLDQARNGAGQQFEYRAGEELWRRTPHFAYRPPPLESSLRRSVPDALILLAWLIATFLLLRFASRRLAREAL